MTPFSSKLIPTIMVMVTRRVFFSFSGTSKKSGRFGGLQRGTDTFLFIAYFSPRASFFLKKSCCYCTAPLRRRGKGRHHILGLTLSSGVCTYTRACVSRGGGKNNKLFLQLFFSRNTLSSMQMSSSFEDVFVADAHRCNMLCTARRQKKKTPSRSCTAPLLQYIISYTVAFLSPDPVTIYLSSDDMSTLSTEDDSFD